MPRAASPLAGLRGPARTPFPQAARDTGPRLGFVSLVQVYRSVSTSDGAGTRKEVFSALGDPIPGRLDYLATGGGGPEVQASQLNEDTTAVVSTEAGSDIRTSDRVGIDGKMFEILGIRESSDPLIMQLEVR